MVRKSKVKWKNVILCCFFFLFSIFFVFSFSYIIKWKLDARDVKKQMDDIEKIVPIQEKEDTKKTEVIKQEEISKANPYWDYIKMSFIDAHIPDLKKINQDTKGWIQVNGTRINYPFVQGNDNKFYLNHSFDKTYNAAGWVFLDYRNDLSMPNKNIILYAHGRLDDIMFGSLKHILSSGWLDDTDNYVIKLSTEYENSLWQVFSVYRIPTTSDYLQVEFSNNQEFLEFSSMLLRRSDYDFHTSISETDQILTLSTCYNDSDKVVLHAKLIKREAR